MSNLTYKRYAVTGSTTPLGRAAATQLAQRGAEVVLLSPSVNSGHIVKDQIIEATGNPHVEMVVCDMASQASIRMAADVINSRFGTLSGLVNIGGQPMRERFETDDGHEMNFGADYLGHFLLTNLLVEALTIGGPSRVITLSGEGHRRAGSPRHSTIDFDDLMGSQSFMAVKAIRQSLLAKIVFSYELARRTAHLGIASIAMCPGITESNTVPFVPWYTRYYTGPSLANPETADEIAAHVTYLLTSPDMHGVTAKYFIQRELALSSPESYDRQIAEKLWAVSEDYVGQCFAHLAPLMG